jgi:hypothetical protein
MKPRQRSQPAGGLPALSAFGLLVGLSMIAGCDSTPPLPPPATSAEAKPAQIKEVGKGHRKVRQSIRDHDEESVSQRFARRAREASQNAAQ